MKFIIAYSAKRKNAKRHVYTLHGHVVYFNSIEEAKNHQMYNHPLYNTEILTANYKKVEENK